jgi:hypothetical protein
MPGGINRTTSFESADRITLDPWQHGLQKFDWSKQFVSPSLTSLHNDALYGSPPQGHAGK